MNMTQIDRSLVVPWLLLCVLTLGYANQGTGDEFYVSTTGNDAHPGSITEPFLTLEHAQTEARRAISGATDGVTVWIRGGTYYLADPLVFGPDDSGTEETPVTYAGYADETVVLSGAKKLTPEWTLHSDTIQVATVGPDLRFDALFVNEIQQTMSRYPNFDPDTIVLNGYAKDALSPERVATWTNPTTGLVRGLHHGRWGGQSFEITGLKSDGNPILDWVGDNNRGSRLHAEYRMVENIFEELDAPGEWFYDQPNGKLYFYPPPNTNLANALIEVATNEELIRIVGTNDRKAGHLTFDNLTFAHTHRTLFTRPYEPLLRSDWCVARAGAVFLQNAENVTVSNSIFDRVGGNGVFASGHNRNHVITQNEFIDNGATCVSFVGLPDAVRDPGFWEDFPTTIRDSTPGPKTDDYPKDCVVSFNHMVNNGRFEKQTCGVNISMAEGITVSHNTVHGSPRAGINICDGTWGGHLIEFNDIFDCVRETSDHGPFNSWGRDRFYALGGYNHNGGGGSEKRPYAFLDAWKTTVIRNNRVHYDEPTSYGIDLDDGSSNYEIYNNLLLNTEIKLREGFNRKVYNNITINKQCEFHVWYDHCGDSFVRNIVVNRTAYNTKYLKSGRAKRLDATIDYNVFYNGGDEVVLGDSGWDSANWDTHSVIADPLFVNPETLDYSVREGSPALELGFANFPMDQFGKPGAPEPNPISFVNEARVDSDSRPLMGARVASINDMSIQSVLGAPDQKGIYFESVPADSYAASQGFKKFDAILAVNDTPVTTMQSFWDVYDSLAAGSNVSITLLRNQHEETHQFVKIRERKRSE
ncbi:PDZ domain-containing protein [Aporhodopirellula aestuarii]|uniref:PDZ domain-containing protein n=1 Tax=Aporhodopirellula aestuarii TaxID=2950107 RepID=A0ABT0TYW9_9BACT|nr:PDZ domain-containing protein [Aporhodopirellula aestuarii]MCM2369730.1 PDZ domain-containing protein [Aporhodopirellula aestuarii]